MSYQRTNWISRQFIIVTPSKPCFLPLERGKVVIFCFEKTLSHYGFHITPVMKHVHIGLHLASSKPFLCVACLTLTEIACRLRKWKTISIIQARWLIELCSWKTITRHSNRYMYLSSELCLERLKLLKSHIFRHRRCNYTQHWHSFNAELIFFACKMA